MQYYIRFLIRNYNNVKFNDENLTLLNALCEFYRCFDYKFHFEAMFESLGDL